VLTFLHPRKLDMQFKHLPSKQKQILFHDNIKLI